MLESAPGVCSRGGGGVWSGGVWSEGVWSEGGWVSAPGGCLFGGVCVCSGWGGVWSGGCVWSGGVWSWGEGHPSMHWGRPPLWTEWMTDRCKNITLATTSLRPVINKSLRSEFRPKNFVTCKHSCKGPFTPSESENFLWCLSFVLWSFWPSLSLCVNRPYFLHYSFGVLTSPSLPSHGSVFTTSGSSAFLTGAVEPRPTAKAL